MGKHRELASIVSRRTWRTIVVASAMLAAPACGGNKQPARHPDDGGDWGRPTPPTEPTAAPAPAPAPTPTPEPAEDADDADRAEGQYKMQKVEDQPPAKSDDDDDAADDKAAAKGDKPATKPTKPTPRPRGTGSRPTGRGFILA